MWNGTPTLSKPSMMHFSATGLYMSRKIATTQIDGSFKKVEKRVDSHHDPEPVPSTSGVKASTPKSPPPSDIDVASSPSVDDLSLLMYHRLSPPPLPASNLSPRHRELVHVRQLCHLTEVRLKILFLFIL